MTLLGALDRNTPIALGGISCPTLVLYGIRAPIIGPLRAWKPPFPYAINNQRGASKIPPSRVLWMRRAGLLWHKRAGAALLWTNESQASTFLDQ